MPRALNEDGIFEAFIQSGAEGEVTHVGSVLAGDRMTAWRLAKDAYGRRDDLRQLWVASRADMVVSTPDDLRVLAAKTRMPHRQAAFALERRETRDRVPSSPAAAEAMVGDGVSPDRRLWAVLADDLFLHAHFLSAGLYDFVELETSLASGSIAQEDLAHAKALAQQCGVATPDIDAYFFDRPAESWWPSKLWRSTDNGWPFIVARGILIASSISTLASSCLGEVDDEWRSLLVVVADEQQRHLDHWSAAAHRLTASPELNLDFLHTLGAVIASGGDLFGTPGDSAGDIRGHRLVPIAFEHAGLRKEWCSMWPDYPQQRNVGTESKVLESVLSDLRYIRAEYAQGVII
ncbi:hypothetical protein [Amycolatopsis benzoatilytica]|uniref:hypothetical protein n=1 Tax=Amycolatopsis benzoatilytica TaxID=346045 RepID=UPI00036B6618|nr:hypothetical protein [Amycolatopsis benzoatilytica]